MSSAINKDFSINSQQLFPQNSFENPFELDAQKLGHIFTSTLQAGGEYQEIAQQIFKALPLEHQTTQHYAEIEKFAASMVMHFKVGDLQKTILPTTKNASGYLNDPLITPKPFPNLEFGYLKTVHAIVLHRTDSTTSNSVWQKYKHSSTGAHFLIDTNGAVYQTASLNKKTQHVGPIRARCQEEQTCSAEEEKTIKTIETSRNAKIFSMPLHNHEMKKNYPDRYPSNSDSIGIEVVGLFNKKSQSYGEPTQEQLTSLKYLVETLKQEYHLTEQDIFKHGVISYKEPSEGKYLGY